MAFSTRTLLVCVAVIAVSQALSTFYPGMMGMGMHHRPYGMMGYPMMGGMYGMYPGMYGMFKDEDGSTPQPGTGDQPLVENARLSNENQPIVENEEELIADEVKVSPFAEPAKEK